MLPALFSWELRRFARLDVFVALLAPLALNANHRLTSRPPSGAFARAITAESAFLALPVTLLFSSAVLVTFALNDQFSDARFLLTRPVGRPAACAARIVRWTLALLLLSSSSLLVAGSRLDGPDAVLVLSCEDVAAYDDAGFSPDIEEGEEAARYRAHREGARPCASDVHAVVRLPGLRARQLALNGVADVAFAASFVALTTLSARRPRDRIRSLTFWLALVPSLMAVALCIRLGLPGFFATPGAALLPLRFHEGTPLLAGVLALVALFYVGLAHHAWRRMEVLTS